jgi:hypothetical protein
MLGKKLVQLIVAQVTLLPIKIGWDILRVPRRNVNVAGTNNDSVPFHDPPRALEVQSVFADFNRLVLVGDGVAPPELENLQIGRPVGTPERHADQ